MDMASGLQRNEDQLGLDEEHSRWFPNKVRTGEDRNTGGFHVREMRGVEILQTCMKEPGKGGLGEEGVSMMELLEFLLEEGFGESEVVRLVDELVEEGFIVRDGEIQVFAHAGEGGEGGGIEEAEDSTRGIVARVEEGRLHISAIN